MKKDKTPFLLKTVRWIFPKLEKYAPSIANRYFVKIFFTPLNYKTPQKELKAETFAKKFTVTVSGKKVQCYEWGKGERYVLLVHGWAGRATQMRRFIKPLIAKGFKVIGFDGPAHGNSEGKTTNLLEFEETFKRIYEVKGEPHAIIAHSFGGVASLFSAKNGLPINKLITIASPTIGDEVIKTYLRAINGSWKTGEFFKGYVLKKYGKTFEELSSLYFVQHLPKPVDLMLVYDEDDKEVSIEHGEELVKVYHNTLFIRTKGLGHTRILKDDSVIRKCVTFINHEASAWSK